MVIGDRVLVRLLAKTGKCKLYDNWEKDPYVDLDIPNEDIPVYKVQIASGKGPSRFLHRNLLLPFMFISETKEVTEKSPLIPMRETRMKRKTGLYQQRR